MIPAEARFHPARQSGRRTTAHIRATSVNQE
jgi:hypothetical protein